MNQSVLFPVDKDVGNRLNLKLYLNKNIFFLNKVVISQFFLLLKKSNLGLMKALRIKKCDDVLNLSRFDIVLLKDIFDFSLSFSPLKNEAVIQLKFQKGGQLAFCLRCDESHFEKFKLRWERFQANEDYYFDLSDWLQIK